MINEDLVPGLELAYARVRYIDLCQHEEASKQAFFAEAGLKTLDVFGLTLELPDLVKVMFYNDLTDDSECEGIVIPRNCVLEIEWLTAAVPEVDAVLLSADGPVN